MSGTDLLVAEVLDRLVPLRLDRRTAWDDVVARAGAAVDQGRQPHRRVRRRRLRRVAIAMAVALAVLALGSAVAAALGHSPFGTLSSWLEGSPGRPAPAPEESGFVARNSAAYAAFPANTKLRLLESVEAAGKTFSLLGFRNRSSLCLRLVRADQPAALGTNQCVTLRELRHSPAPALVASTASFAFGTTETGVEGVFGFADDTVRAIDVRRLHGSPTAVRVVDNVFVALWRARFGDDGGLVGQNQIVQIRAVTRAGRRMRVPFSGATLPPPKRHVPSYFRPVTAADIPGPAKAEAPLPQRTISWLLNHEPRGRPFLPQDSMNGKVVFSRSIQPDPDSPSAVTLSLTSGPDRGGSGTLFWGTPSFMNIKPHRLTLCVGVAGPLGGPGGMGDCEQRRWQGSFFPPGRPVSVSGSTENPQIQSFYGVVADGITEVDVYLATGRVIPAALRDNAYIVDVPTAQYPAKFVAFDEKHRPVMVWMWPDYRRSVLAPCPAATQPGATRPPKAYERLDLGAATVDGKRIFGVTPGEVSALLGPPDVIRRGRATTVLLYGARDAVDAGLAVGFSLVGNGFRATSLTYRAPNLVDRRLGRLLRLQPLELQRRIGVAYGATYGRDVGYGNEGQLGCAGRFHARRGSVELSFGLEPSGSARPYVTLRDLRATPRSGRGAPPAPALGGTVSFTAGTAVTGYELYLANSGRPLVQLTHGELESQNPIGAAWSPDGSRLVAAAANGVYLVSTDGTSDVRATDIRGAWAWLPDSRRVVFSDNGSAGSIYITSVDGAGRPRLLASDSAGWSLSPDGTRIAFTGRTRRGCSALFLVNTDGPANVRQIPIRPGIPSCARPHFAYGTPAWSPDGSELAVLCCSNWWDRSSVYLLRPDGSGVRRIHRGATSIEWSPDGLRIAFATGVNQWSWSAMDFDGSHVHRLCSACTITWFSDGSRLAYARPPGVFVVRADGSGRTLVARTRLRYGAFAVSADGSMIVYAAVNGVAVVDLTNRRRRLVAHSPTTRYWAPSWRPAPSRKGER